MPYHTWPWGPKLWTQCYMRKYQRIGWKQKCVCVRVCVCVVCVCIHSGLSPDEWELTPCLPQLLLRAIWCCWEYSSIFHQNVGDWSVGRWIISFLKTTRSPLFTHIPSSDNFIFTQPPLVLPYVFFSSKNMRPHLYSWIFTFQERVLGQIEIK